VDIGAAMTADIYLKGRDVVALAIGGFPKFRGHIVEVLNNSINDRNHPIPNTMTLVLEWFARRSEKPNTEFVPEWEMYPAHEDENGQTRLTFVWSADTSRYGTADPHEWFVFKTEFEGAEWTFRVEPHEDRVPRELIGPARVAA
jgi:hypothetical protein